jgi:glycosidase
LERHGHWLKTFAPLTFVGNHDVSRLASTLTDARHVGHALAVLFTVGGTPSIYYGDERAARGVKEERVGGDDAVRPQFPGEPGPLDDEGERTYRLHQLLIGFRRRQAWLHEARTSTVQLANAVFGYESRHGEHRIVTALNLSDESATVQVQAGLTEVLSADGAASIHGENLVVPAHEWAIAY